MSISLVVCRVLPHIGLLLQMLLLEKSVFEVKDKKYLDLSRVL